MGFWRNTELVMTDAHRSILQRLIAAGGELPHEAVGWGELYKMAELVEVGFVNLRLPGQPYRITHKGQQAALTKA